jgi:hypothetical protein
MVLQQKTSLSAVLNLSLKYRLWLFARTTGVGLRITLILQCLVVKLRIIKMNMRGHARHDRGCISNEEQGFQTSFRKAQLVARVCMVLLHMIVTHGCCCDPGLRSVSLNRRFRAGVSPGRKNLQGKGFKPLQCLGYGCSLVSHAAARLPHWRDCCSLLTPTMPLPTPTSSRTSSLFLAQPVCKRCTTPNTLYCDRG